jgi:hypothetical protein
MSYPGSESSSNDQPAEPTFPGSAPAFPPAPSYPPATPAFPATVPPPAGPPPPSAPPAPGTTGAMPAYTPGYTQVPVPSAPTYDPSMAQPYSAPPVSAPYGYMPVPSAIPAPPPRRGRVGVVILSILTTLLLLATGVMTTLYIQQKQTADKSATQVEQLTKQVGDQTTKIDSMQRDIDSAQRDLTDAKAASDEALSQKKVLVDCLNALYAFLKAANDAQGKQTATVKAKEADFEAKCTPADKYL